MEYPKPIMRLSELEKMGFPKQYLLNAYWSDNQTFAWKTDMTKDNSPIVFDTQEFEQYRLNLLKAEKRANKVRRVV